MNPNESDSKPARLVNNKSSISINLRFLVLILVLVIGGMLYVWKPWSQSVATSDVRTITVSGESKIKAEPDEFVFQPSYDFKDASKDVALSSLAQKSDEIVKKLKELGVPENKIKTSSDGYNYSGYYYDGPTGQNTYSLRLTITLNDRKQAQKVQDYLVTTSPSGQLSPQTIFSEAKSKQLKSQARDAATKDARAKADQSAKNIGFKLGKVKSLQDGTDYGGIERLFSTSDQAAGTTESKTRSLNVQPGEDSLSYSVKVVYYIR